MTTTTTNCIICYKTCDSNEADNNVDKELQQYNHNKFLEAFCRQFDVHLPQNFSMIQWDFQVEPVPFCPMCQETADSLVKLQQQLESIKMSMNQLQNTVRNQILNSWRHHNSDLSKVGDRRVNIIRDFIIGPILSIPKLETNNKEVERYTRKNNKRVSKESVANHDFSDLDYNEVQKMEPSFFPMSDDDELRFDFASSFHPVHFTKTVNSSQNNPYRRHFDWKEGYNSNSDTFSDEEEGYVPFNAEWDSDFEPSREDWEDYNEQIKKKYVIRQQKSIARGNLDEPTSCEQMRRKSVSVVKLTDAGQYSYSGWEFEKTEDGFKCKSCEREKKYKSEVGVVTHIRQRHLNETRSHLCSTCGRAFYKPSQLRLHMTTHDETCQVICHVCGGSYKNEILLSAHIAKVHEAVYDFPCELCPEKFKSDKRLQQHVKKFHPSFAPPRQLKEPSYFACEFCDSTFRRVENFKKHVQRFHDSQSFNYKVKKYSGVRPFHCPHCSQKYRRELDLTFHIKRIHTKTTEPPVLHRCHFCDKTYKTRPTMRRHEISAHKHDPGFKWIRKNTSKFNDQNGGAASDGEENELVVMHASQMEGQVEEEICLSAIGF